MGNTTRSYAYVATSCIMSENCGPGHNRFGANSLGTTFVDPRATFDDDRLQADRADIPESNPPSQITFSQMLPPP